MIPNDFLKKYDYENDRNTTLKNKLFFRFQQTVIKVHLSGNSFIFS